MQAIFAKIKNNLPKMNIISRRYIKHGTAVVIILYFLAAVCGFLMGRVGNYDYLLFVRNNLLSAGGEMISAVYVPALLVEIARLAYCFQFGQNEK